MESIRIDPAFLDIENMTSDQWRALITSKMANQKDEFLNECKHKMINDMKMVIQSSNLDDSTRESLQEKIINTVNENKFEFEFKKFTDNIVGATFEYICQLIIKNSLENITRTRNAINSLKSDTNENASHCCNGINLQESFLTQICVPESNNNTTDLAKIGQHFMVNNITQNEADSLIDEKVINKNHLDNKLEPTSFQAHRQSLKNNNVSLPLEQNISSEIIAENNYVCLAHSSVNIEEDDDLKTTEAIISLAQKISEQEIHFKFSDGFEDEKITNVESIDSKIQTNNSFAEQNKEQHVDSHRQEDEYKMHNSLKLLESLVNIEHDKLEGQTSLTINNIQETHIESNSKQSNTNVQNKKSPKLKQINQCLDKKKCEFKDTKQTDCLTNKNKSIKIKNSKRVNVKLDNQNDFDNKSCNTSNFLEIKNDENISGIINISNNQNFETTSDTTNIKILASTSSSESQIITENTKNNVSISESKTRPTNDNTSINEKVNSYFAYDYNDRVLSTKATFLPSINSCKDIDIKSVKNKSSRPSSSPMKTSDYKKLYERERKSLFNPDIIIRSPSLKDSTENVCITKEKEHQLFKTMKTSITKLDTKKKQSAIKKKSSQRQSIKVKITSGRSNKQDLNKSKVESTPSTSKMSSSDIVHDIYNKSKRLKIEHKSEDKTKNIAPNIVKNKMISNTANSSCSGNSNNVNILTINDEPNMTKLCNIEKDENSSKTDSIIQKQLQQYGIKPCYVVIDRNRIY